MRVKCLVTLVVSSLVPQKIFRFTLLILISLQKMWTVAIGSVWKRMEAVVDSAHITYQYHQKIKLRTKIKFCWGSSWAVSHLHPGDWVCSASNYHSMRNTSGLKWIVWIYSLCTVFTVFSVLVGTYLYPIFVCWLIDT